MTKTFTEPTGKIYDDGTEPSIDDDELERKYKEPAATSDDLPEGHPSKASDDADKIKELEDSFDSPSDGDNENSQFRVNLNSNLDSIKNNKKKLALVSGVVGIFSLIFLIIGLIFNSLGPLKLDTILKNIEAKAFLRYQVAADKRTTKWINAYMLLRMGEVEDPKLLPKDRDNIIFRANSVDDKNPIKAYYKTLRTSKFEQDLFELQGIKFTSIAQRTENGGIRTRPAIVKIRDKEVKFDLNEAEYKAIDDMDLNSFNGRLREFIDVDVMESDKDARRAIKLAVNDNTRWWQMIKRRHMRKNIQNMIGVRDWRFFEKTRNKIQEAKIDVRNKIIRQAFPSDSKTSMLIKCFFGQETCIGSRDPIDPKARDNSLRTSGKPNDSDLPPAVDQDGKPLDSDNPADTYESILREGLGASPDELSKGLRGFIIKKLAILLAGSNVPGLNIVLWLDTISTIDDSVKSGGFTKLIYLAKASSYIGLYTTYATARDQMKTGELNPEELDSFMETLTSASNSEGWTKVVHNNNTVSAESTSLTAAKDKEQYCSDEYQELLRDPKNREFANKQYAYNCNVIGKPDNNNSLVTSWNMLTSGPIGAILAIYKSTIGPFVGLILDLIGNVLGFIQQIFYNIAKNIPILSNIIGTIEELISWAVTKIADFIGIPPIDQTDPAPDRGGNQLIQGAAATAEMSARYQGASISNPQSVQYAIENLQQYTNENINNQSIYDKYISIDNYDSALSSTINGLSDNSTNINLSIIIKNSASLLYKSTIGIISSKTKASSSEGYSAANFAEIETYDWPKKCFDLDILTMQPKDVTNADELGWFTPEELTWDLVNNNTDFYDELYRRITARVSEVYGDGNGKYPDDYAVEVNNCAALDTTIRGGLGAKYGYTDDNGLEDTSSEYDDSSNSDTQEPISSSYGPFVFPVNTTQDEIKNNNPHWCYDKKDTTCHGTEADGYYASDIFIKGGVPIVSATNGTVVRVGKEDALFGQSITIKADDCEDGKLTCKGEGTLFYYTHMKPDSQKVKAGDRVTAGQEIGTSGTNEDTGNGSAAHLHFDAQDRKNKYRGGCQRSNLAACKSEIMINLQPLLYDAFNNLGNNINGETPSASGSWTWPTKGKVTLSSCFAEVRSKGPHPGLDINVDYVKAYAVADGVVYNNPGGPWGILIIQHPNNIYSVYEHMSKITVKNGDTVKVGQEIGVTGNTAPPGGSTGAHLHFGITTDPNYIEYSDMGKGKIINPLVYINDNKGYGNCLINPRKS